MAFFDRTRPARHREHGLCRGWRHPARRWGLPSARPSLMSRASRHRRGFIRTVQFQVRQFNVVAGWAFVHAVMQRPDGRPIDCSRTPDAEAARRGGKSNRFAALLRQQGEGWKVVAYAVGPTGCRFGGGWSKEYSAPSELFGMPTASPGPMIMGWMGSSSGGSRMACVAGCLETIRARGQPVRSEKSSGRIAANWLVFWQARGDRVPRCTAPLRTGFGPATDRALNRPLRLQPTLCGIAHGRLVHRPIPRDPFQQPRGGLSRQAERLELFVADGASIEGTMVYAICFGRSIAQVQEDAATAADALDRMAELANSGAVGLQVFDAEGRELDQAALQDRAKLESGRRLTTSP